MASEDLLKKAVAAFNALSSEQQAEMLEEQRQSWVRGNIGLSRDKRDMTSPVMHCPEPAATDTGLETVEYQVRSKLNGHWVKDNFLSQQLSPDTERRELVTRSQADDLLAAERADKRIWMEKAAIEAERVERLEADNAAQAARIKELEWKAHNAALSNKIGEDSAPMLWSEYAEALEAKLAAAEQAARAAHETLIEINPSNYNHDDVCQLNDASVEAIFLLADILGETHGKTKEWWDERRAVLGGKPS